MGVNIRHVDETINNDVVLPKRILIPCIPPGVCFICRSAEKLRSLQDKQQKAGETDDYVEMFSICYNMEMMYKGKYAEICQACVDRLKDALLFRRQVEAVNQSWQQETLFDDSLPQYNLLLPDEFSNEVIEWPERHDDIFDICALKSSQEIYEDFDTSKQIAQAQNINDVFMSQYDAPSPIDSFTQTIEFTWQDETANIGSSVQHSSREVGEIVEATNSMELFGESWQQETLDGECGTFFTENFRKDQNQALFNGIEDEYGEILPADVGAVCPDKNIEYLENCNSASKHTGDVSLQYEVLSLEPNEIIELSSQKECNKHFKNIEVELQTKNIIGNKKRKLSHKSVSKIDNIKYAPYTKDTKVKNVKEAINCVIVEGLIENLNRNGEQKKINKTIPDFNENLEMDKAIPRLPNLATSCPICNLKETTQVKLSKHYYAAHFPNFDCNICGKVFHRILNYKTHLSNHDSKKLICKQLCDKRYSNRDCLYNHIQIYNRNKKTYACTKCPEKFSGNPTRSRHMFEKHSIPCKQYTCKDCGKVFYTVQDHTSHVKRTHLYVKEHKCTQCERTFCTACELKRHMVTHDDERNHTCERCGKMYKSLRVLKVHQKKHCHLEIPEEE